MPHQSLIPDQGKLFLSSEQGRQQSQASTAVNDHRSETKHTKSPLL